MSYTITDITELVRSHLVLAEPDDARADDNLAHLLSELQIMATRSLWQEISWVFCDRCRCSVDADLIHPDGHRYFDDGDLYCADCWSDGG